MIDYQSNEQIKTEGTFLNFADGYYNFELNDGELLAFEEVSLRVKKEYDLKSNDFKKQKFEILYSIIIDDSDEEDFIILRLDNLKIL